MASSMENGCVSNEELLCVAVTLVLKDEGFGLPSPTAEKARKAAGKLLEWRGENDPLWTEFADELVSSLKGYFHLKRKVRNRLQRERMWGSYHKLCSSKVFKDGWAKFLHNSISCDA